MATLDVEPVWRARNHQGIFRCVLDAAARPGTIGDLSGFIGEAEAAVGILAALCDNSQSLADLTGRLGASERRFLRAATCAPEAARFVLADGAVGPGLLEPRLGTLEQPELGATIVIRVRNLAQGVRLRLSGPGIAGSREAAVDGLHAGWLEARRRWCADFPLGCDIILADEARVAVLPRTTVIEKVLSWPM